MTARDRIVLAVLACAAIIAGVWFEVVAPERQKADEAQAQVESAHAALMTAQQQAATARGQTSHLVQVARSNVALKPAVPVRKAVPMLIDEISGATGDRSIEFSSIQAAASTATAVKTTSAAAPTTVEGMTPMQFTFQFTGDFFQLESLLRRFAQYVHPTHKGLLVVDGRLLVFNSLTLQPLTEANAHKKKFTLQGQVTATVFTAPAATIPVVRHAGTSSSSSGGAGGSSVTNPAVVPGGKP